MRIPSTILVSLCGVLASLWSLPAQADSTYVVDRLSDSNPFGGGIGSGQAGDLRYAISNARSGDLITFNVPAGTINLGRYLPALVWNITIQGPGANLLAVKGSGGSVFNVTPSTRVVISGVTITGGDAQLGAGIYNSGLLTLNDSTVRGNRARYQGGDPNNGSGEGGGIYNIGTLTLNGCTVSNNTTEGQYVSSLGGGIFNSGTLTVINSTIADNRARHCGGGIANFFNLTVLNSTIGYNESEYECGSSVYTDVLNTTFTVRNTIFRGWGSSEVVGSVNSQGHNLVRSTWGSSGFRPDLGDLLNVDPRLDYWLVYNGGPTPTQALLPGSPAIDHGDNAGAPPYDQRGAGFPRTVNGTTDIGAFEAQAESHPGAVQATLTVTKTDANVRLTWMPSCSASANDYEIYEGSIGNWYSHAAIVCSDSDHNLTETIAPGVGNRYYLVVPRNTFGEGSYGLDSNGVQRPAGTTVCAPPLAPAGCQ